MPSTPPGCCYASLSLTTSFSSLPLPNLLPVHLGSFFTHIRGWFKPLTQTPGALQGSHRTISLGRSQSTDSFPLRASNLLLPGSFEEAPTIQGADAPAFGGGCDDPPPAFGGASAFGGAPAADPFSAAAVQEGGLGGLGIYYCVPCLPTCYCCCCPKLGRVAS